MLAEFGQFLLRRSAAIGSDRFDQRAIRLIEIDILERRRLVEDSWVAKVAWVMAGLSGIKGDAG